MSDNQNSDELKNGIGLTGFILALVGLTPIPVVGWVVRLLGLIFSIIGVSRGNKGAPYKGLSVAGVIISLAGFILGILFVTVFAALTLGAMDGLWHFLN